MRGAPRRTRILPLIATPVSSTGYDSTLPYMEQKRGAAGRAKTCFNLRKRLFFAITHGRVSSYVNNKLLLDTGSVPRTFVK